MVAVKSEITAQDAVEFEGWLKAIEPGRSKMDMDLIRRACFVAQQAHQGQTRASGEPYFQHSLAVANILADLRLDSETLAAAVLHDVLEDTPVTLEELETEFGLTVAKLVDGVTKMGQIQEYRGQERKTKKERAQAESLRKMLIAMVDDVRVVLIKLADRTHNMRTLVHLREDKRQRIARETLDIFAPLANRLGIWQIKWELEDLSFRYLEPELYKQIASMVDERRINREQYINRVAEKLKAELQLRGIEAEVTGRPKHIYSIWRKMKRKGVNFDQIYDVQAVRVLVDEIADCYAVLGIVHTLWRPVPGEFDDYIATPKDNLYRSLHTAVFGPEGKTIEVQIRTHEMHQDAELGVAAHWRYKEGARSNLNFDRKVAWLRQLMEWKDDVADATEFIDQVKAEVFQDRVHVLTPQGDAIDLPAGATPIDFAYHIHTEIGHRCRGAKVNGRIVPLTYKLKNGEQVEILTAKRGGPSRDWINNQLGYLKTARARAKVRQWFKRLNYEENVTHGRTILDRELHRLGVAEVNHEKLAREFNYSKVDDFLAAIGRGDINPSHIVSAINDIIEATQPREEKELYSLTSPTTTPTSPTGIRIQGVGNLLTNLAQCCRPVPGDDAIIGFITRGRGVTIHRRDCPNVLRFNEEGRERLIEVDWDTKGDDTYPVDIEIDAFDRPGLLRDITAVVANEKINISSVSVITRRQELKAKVYATLEIANIDQLSRVLALIAQLPNIIEVRRRRK
ncbi:MAG: GTP diphosphokinase [Anaerolineae bacterium]|nr:GTP diphosphokinase [Anaerolineales bacterium]MCQ3978649.1 GTP diphosphokinase [Anaerolineae bacterium]